MKASSWMSAVAGVVVLILIFDTLVFSSEFEFQTVSKKAQKVRDMYSAQLGIREKGENAGKQVEAYLRYVGLAKGNPWCAAFVCWVLGEAGVENPKTGWSPGLFPAERVIWSRSKDFGSVGVVSRKDPPPAPSERGIRGKASLTTTSGTQPITRNTQPSQSDVFGIYFMEKGRIAHVGFVDEWNDDWLITVEGNTNPSGSREGDGVYRKRRLVSTIYKVARYVPEERRVGS